MLIKLFLSIQAYTLQSRVRPLPTDPRSLSASAVHTPPMRASATHCFFFFFFGWGGPVGRGVLRVTASASSFPFLSLSTYAYTTVEHVHGAISQTYWDRLTFCFAPTKMYTDDRPLFSVSHLQPMLSPVGLVQHFAALC